MRKRDKKILVSGGAGFIGSHLCEYLLQKGHQIICLDDLSSGSKRNIEHLLENKNFRLVEQDVVLPYFCRVDEIYNLACPASPVHYQQNSIKTLKTNILGAINMLDLALHTKAKILQASTSEIYGDPLIHPQKESYWGNVNPIGKRSCYEEGKRCAETLFMDYRRQYRVSIKIVRIFNTYGPRMALDDGRVVSNFIVQALKNQPITIYGDGKQTRSFQYIDDLILGMVKMMEKDNFIGPVNLGNPKEITIKKLALKIVKLTKSKSKLVFKPLPIDDPRRRKPDISLAKKKLGWYPKINLKKGLRKTIAYFKEELD
ncbi:MAG: SDR family oxidoreductase [Patescibacteria group bacterium]|nr:SDR family oxidoreductase [Patescibacteria group bacterium]